MIEGSGRDDSPIETKDDDDALSWGPSSHDASYLETPVDDVSDKRTGAAEGSDETEPDEADDALPEGVLSSGMLVVHGVAAMIYILFTIAWLKSIGTVAPSFDSALALWMWRIGTWLAIGGPALWYAGTILLTPTTASQKRVVSFVVGAVVLLPWPFLISGVA